jgi:hypothetical protein
MNNFVRPEQWHAAMDMTSEKLNVIIQVGQVTYGGVSGK